MGIFMMMVNKFGKLSELLRDSFNRLSEELKFSGSDLEKTSHKKIIGLRTPGTLNKLGIFRKDSVFCGSSTIALRIWHITETKVLSFSPCVLS